MPRTDRREIGRAGEELAARFLELEGYALLERNAHHADVEVDIVARKDTLLVLVEVKLRRRGLERAVEGLRVLQRRRLERAVHALLERHDWAKEVRLDVLGVDWREGELRLLHLRGVG